MTRYDDTFIAVFVFVVYNQYRTLDETFSSQLPLPSDALIVVVDNSERSGRRPEMTAKWEAAGVRVLYPVLGNVGYAGAAQFAYEELKLEGDYQFFCLCNSDLYLDFNSFVAILNRDFAGRAGLGLIAPTLKGPLGEDVIQRHYSAPPRSIKYRRLSCIYSIYPLAVAHRLLSDMRHKFTRLITRRSESAQVRHEVFAPHGALIVATRDYMTSTSGFEMPVFLFCEEIFVGAYCREAGLDCVVSPDLQYRHVGHQSMGSVPSRKIATLLSDAHLAAAQRLLADELRSAKSHA